MIAIARIRELLGPDADGLSDVELDAIRQDAYSRMRHLVMAFEDRQRGSRRPRMTDPEPRTMRVVSR